jgi:hypothetical protein
MVTPSIDNVLKGRWAPQALSRAMPFCRRCSLQPMPPFPKCRKAQCVLSALKNMLEHRVPGGCRARRHGTIRAVAAQRPWLPPWRRCILGQGAHHGSPAAAALDRGNHGGLASPGILVATLDKVLRSICSFRAATLINQGQHNATLAVGCSPSVSCVRALAALPIDKCRAVRLAQGSKTKLQQSPQPHVPPVARIIHRYRQPLRMVEIHALQSSAHPHMSQTIRDILPGPANLNRNLNRNLTKLASHPEHFQTVTDGACQSQRFQVLGSSGQIRRTRFAIRKGRTIDGGHKDPILQARGATPASRDKSFGSSLCLLSFVNQRTSVKRSPQVTVETLCTFLSSAKYAAQREGFHFVTRAPKA